MEFLGNKMIVVVLVLVVILIGLTLFMFYIERRLKQSEKKLDEFRKKCTCTEHPEELP